MRDIIGIISGLMWVTGWVLSSGFWQTFFAVVFFPYSWYIVVEFAMKYWGLI
jgi:hypothetical protein